MTLKSSKTIFKFELLITTSSGINKLKPLIPPKINSPFFVLKYELPLNSLLCKPSVIFKLFMTLVSILILAIPKFVLTHGLSLSSNNIP